MHSICQIHISTSRLINNDLRHVTWPRNRAPDANQCTHAIRLLRKFLWHGQFVPEDGTNVRFTAFREGSILQVSSSGGGLFGRPLIREDLGRFLILGQFFRPRLPFCQSHYLNQEGFQVSRILSCKRIRIGSGAPWKIRTSDLLVRSQTLYPAELRARCGQIHEPAVIPIITESFGFAKIARGQALQVNLSWHGQFLLVP